MIDPIKQQRLKVFLTSGIAVVVVIIAAAVALMYAHHPASAPAGGTNTNGPVTPSSPNWENECIYTNNLQIAEANPLEVCSLDLFAQGLTSIPTSVFSMTNLEYLNLAANNITMVPPEIGNLTHLRQLYLNQNQITSLPDTMGQLSDLEMLTAEWDNITALPTDLSGMTGMQSLIIKGNPLPSAEVARARTTFTKASIIF